ncbi:MAG: glycosyltransferase family 39 protein [Candidatus Andersenbacteria bacterium]
MQNTPTKPTLFKKLQAWLPRLVPAVLFLGITFFATFAAYRSVSSFDGAMNLQVPVTLIKEHRYATHYGSIVDFDHKIQTGPTVLVPIALTIGVFGKSFFSASLVNLVYLLGFLGLLFLFVRRLVGPWWATLAVTLVFVVPRFLNIAINQYGEIPGLFFALSAALVLDRVARSPRRRLLFAVVAGVLLGLSVLTKTVMLIVVPSFVVVLLLDRLLTKRIAWRHYLAFFISSVVPYAAFELFKLWMLGLTQYKLWWATELGAVSSQAGVAEGTFSDTPGLLHKLVTHIGLLGKEFGASQILMLALVILPVLLVIGKTVQLVRQKKTFTWPLSFFTVAGIAYSYFGWWLLITPTARAWHRRILDGVIVQEVLLVLTLAVLVVLIRKTTSRPKKIGALLAALLIVLTMLWQVTVFTPRLRTEIQAAKVRQTVEYLAGKVYQLPEDARIYGTGWWQSPRMSFLSGRTFESINHNPPQESGPLTHTYFVVEREAYALSRPEIDRILSWFDYEVVENKNSGNGYYSIYQLNYFNEPPEQRGE